MFELLDVLKFEVVEDVEAEAAEAAGAPPVDVAAGVTDEEATAVLVG